MYSIVLMVAMTHGAATPTTAFENGADFNQVRYGNHLRQEDYRFGRRGRRGRRGGCCGGGYGGWNSCGCCGGGYGGWSCSGGGYGGGWGCCGGGYASSYGCCGGGYGGWSCCGGGYGMPVSYGCTGGGMVYEGSMGGWGGSMGAPPAQGPGRIPMPGPAGGNNPYRYNYGSGYTQPGFGEPPAGGFNEPGAPPPPATGGLNEPGAPPPPPPAGRNPARNPAPEPLNPPAGSQTRAEAPATFTVHLPANAKLFVDRQLTKSTSATRTFVTPPLPENQSFTYTLKAQLTGSGQPVTQTITVRGGQNTDVTLQFPEQRLTRK